MVGVVADDDLPQPLPLPGNGLVHPPSQLLLDRPELRLHAVTAGLPIDLEVTPTRLATNEGKAQEREGLRLAKPAPRSVRRCPAAALHQAGLVRMQRQRKLLQARARIASRKRRASASCSKPTTMSSA